MNMRRFIKILVTLILTSALITSCGVGKKLKSIHKPVDLRNEPLDPDERAKRNIREGRGLSLGNLGKKSTTYEFSTSNPMWRASLEVLDFIPLTTVDYSGGMIITDWYSEGVNSNEDSLKITVRFLSNEIRSDSIKIVVHKKNCKNMNNCSISLLPNSSKINSELRSVILKKATLFEKNTKEKKKK
tara:strand:+ start:7318 stop:7875 length:558 start_codon:yes stop_codon:yes gene_type:complete